MTHRVAVASEPQSGVKPAASGQQAAKDYVSRFTPEGGWVVLEVSAFGGFRGLHSALGVDAAPLVARAALERLTAGQPA